MICREAARRNERGSVLVLAALWMPVVILMASFVIDAGNWFEHKRHLQLQADAGAFAAGSLFNGCFGDQAAANTLIDAQVRKYAGDPGGTAPFNLQIGGTNQGAVTVRINKKMFQVDGPGPDDTIEDVPCAAKMVDVKITEAGLPWFLGGNLVSAINARARVQLEQKGSSSDSLPVGVPDNNPLAAAAIFVDESNANTVLATQPLTKSPDTPVLLNGQSLYQWTGLPISVNVTHANIGIVVALSGKAGWTPPGGSLTNICNVVLVECYFITQDNTGNVTAATGLEFIHGYPTTGTGSASSPILRDVTLYNPPGGCTDGSGPYFLLNSNCKVGVKAKIDFGAASPSTIVVKAAGPNGTQDYGCAGGNPKGCPLTFDPATGYWSTTNAGDYPTIPPAASSKLTGGAAPIDLNWKTATSNGTFTSVQRAFPADLDTSGPVEFMRVDNEAGPYGNSVGFGSHTFNVTIGVKGSLQANADSPTAPVVALKVTSKGSNGQAIDCDPGAGTNLRYELSYGCTPHYAINKGELCKSASYYVFPQSEDWKCTVTQTGGSVGQVDDGMLCRTQGNCYSPATCNGHYNHWVDSNGDGKITIPQDIAPNDPRLTSVFVTPFGAFSGNGTQVVPVTNFATFYVTGWSKNGGGQGDPCTASPGPDPVPAKTGGWIVGHFIKYVDTLGGRGDGETCDFNLFGSCVAVLTK
jgi:putative Flp pilus-assembly TadE/G-like protein